MNIIKIKQFLVAMASVCLSAGASADTYTYDNLSRLTSVLYSSGQQITYSYDPAGNRLARTGSVLTASAAPFIDDQFNGVALDPLLWTTGGNSATVHDGYLDLQANQTDNTGWVKTTFSERQHIRVEILHRMHAANGYFFPSITLGATNPNGQVTVRWLRSGFGPDYCNLAANYDRVEILAGVNSSAACLWTFSNLVSSSYYDRWIVSILDYDVATGLVTLDTDSDGVIDFTATVDPANRSPITSVHLQGYGWNTGHLHQVDYIKVFDFDPSLIPQTINFTNPGTRRLEQRPSR